MSTLWILSTLEKYSKFVEYKTVPYRRKETKFQHILIITLFKFMQKLKREENKTIFTRRPAKVSLQNQGKLWEQRASWLAFVPFVTKVTFSFFSCYPNYLHLTKQKMKITIKENAFHFLSKLFSFLFSQNESGPTWKISSRRIQFVFKYVCLCLYKYIIYKKEDSNISVLYRFDYH